MTRHPAHPVMWQADVIPSPPPPRQHRDHQARAVRMPSIRLSRKAKLIGAVVLVLFAMTAYAIARAAAGVQALADGFDDGIQVDWSRLQLAAWLLLPAAWVGGQLKRGKQHAWGIWKSHLGAVKGIGLAALLVVAAVFVAVGGLS